VQVVPDPELLFDGFIDQATIDLASKRDDLEYTVISAFDYFFEDSEGQRLNGQFHQSVWTGEKGLDNVTGVTKKIYWGAYGPNAAGGIGRRQLEHFLQSDQQVLQRQDGQPVNLIQRATRTQKTVDIWKGRPFSDGTGDCVQLVKAHARHLGGSDQGSALSRRQGSGCGTARAWPQDLGRGARCPLSPHRDGSNPRRRHRRDARLERLLNADGGGRQWPDARLSRGHSALRHPAAADDQRGVADREARLEAGLGIPSAEHCLPRLSGSAVVHQRQDRDAALDDDNGRLAADITAKPFSR
jgi:hypothetical protein